MRRDTRPIGSNGQDAGKSCAPILESMPVRLRMDLKTLAGRKGSILATRAPVAWSNRRGGERTRVVFCPVTAEASRIAVIALGHGD